MRALIVAVLVALCAGGGYLAYQHFTPPKPVAVKAPPPKPRPAAEYCASADALYAMRSNHNYTMRLGKGGSYVGPIAFAQDFPRYSAGERTFVLTTADKRTFRFALLASRGYTSNYLFPIKGENALVFLSDVDLIPLTLFDTNYNYIPGLPIMGSAAPGHIWAPNIARYLYNHGGEPKLMLDMDLFDFIDCVPADAPISSAPSVAP